MFGIVTVFPETAGCPATGTKASSPRSRVTGPGVPVKVIATVSPTVTASDAAVAVNPSGPTVKVRISAP